MASRGFFVIDGCLMADASGDRYEVFNPSWWRIDRWVRYLLAKRKGKAQVTLTDNDGRVVTMDLRIAYVAGGEPPRAYR